MDLLHALVVDAFGRRRGRQTERKLFVFGRLWTHPCLVLESRTHLRRVERVARRKSGCARVQSSVRSRCRRAVLSRSCRFRIRAISLGFFSLGNIWVDPLLVLEGRARCATTVVRRTRHWRSWRSAVRSRAAVEVTRAAMMWWIAHAIRRHLSIRRWLEVHRVSVRLKGKKQSTDTS